MSGVLAGVRVLDFGRYIAGPFCATLLGDLGAEVIRIEKVAGSEDRYVSSVAAGGEGGTFLQMGRNKLGLTLNPMKPKGREVVGRLVKTADVVIANLPVDTLKGMGIDYESLRALKPDIILTHVSAFGKDGPYAPRVGFDLMGQAMSGAMHLTGLEGAPTRTHVPYVDYGTALFAAVGTLAALLERSRTGTGQEVEASLLSTSLAFNNNLLIEQAVLAPGRQAQGNRGFHHAPNDSYRTSDGWIVTMVVGNPLFERWARLVGAEEWLTDPRFDSDLNRGRQGGLISERMAAWCAQRNSAEALQALAEARIPAGPVYTPQQALDDPHIKARKLFKPVDYPGLPSPAPLADLPVRFSNSTAGIRHRPPTLGEHTDTLLKSLGYDEDEITRMRAERIV